MGTTGSDLSIRPLDPADAPMAARALSAWMTNAFSGSLPQAVVDAFTVERSERRLSAPALTLAAWQESTLVGLGQADGNEISMLYVSPDCRGTGVGEKLFASLLDAIGKAGYSQAELVVLVANEGARRFYERQGGRILKDDNVHMAGYDLPHKRYVFPL